MSWNIDRLNMNLATRLAAIAIATSCGTEGTAVTQAYAAPLKFTGKIEKVTVELK